MTERTIATQTHGRFLVDLADAASPHVLLVGFHGYAEQATLQLERLRAVRGASTMSLVAIQGLHRFYRTGGEEIAASWMTREDRELMIADNVSYVNAVLDAVVHEVGEPLALVFAGFSQGAAMAYRAAALCVRLPSGVIALGGDVPPELGRGALTRIPRVLIGWGVRDGFYGEATRRSDEHRLGEAGAQVTVAELDAGHKWTEAFTAAAAEWVTTLG